MAAIHPALIAESVGGPAGSPNRVDVPIPALTKAGDKLIIIVNLGWGTANDSLTTPSGWTQDLVQNNATADISTWVYSRTADGTEGGTTVSIPRTKNDAYASAVCLVFRGAGAHQVAGNAMGTASTTLAWPSVNTVDGDVVVAHAHGSGTSAFALTAGVMGFGMITTSSYAISRHGLAAVGAATGFTPSLNASVSQRYNLVLIRVSSGASDSLSVAPRAYTAHKFNSITSFSLSPPPTAQGTDTLVVATVSDQQITPPTGWTALVAQAQKPSGGWVGAWYRTNPGAAQTWTLAASGVVDVAVFASATAPSNPTSASLTAPGPDGTEAGATIAIPAPTGTATNDLVVAMGAFWPPINYERYGYAKNRGSLIAYMAADGTSNPMTGPLLASGPNPLAIVQTEGRGQYWASDTYEAVVFRLPGPAGSTAYQRGGRIGANGQGSAAGTLTARRGGRVVALATGSGGASLGLSRRGRVSILGAGSVAVGGSLSRRASLAGLAQAAATGALARPRRVQVASVGSLGAAAGLTRPRAARAVLLGSDLATGALARPRKGQIALTGAHASVAALMGRRAARIAAMAASAATGTLALRRAARVAATASGLLAVGGSIPRRTVLAASAAATAAALRTTPRRAIGTALAVGSAATTRASLRAAALVILGTALASGQRAARRTAAWALVASATGSAATTKRRAGRVAVYILVGAGLGSGWYRVSVAHGLAYSGEAGHTLAYTTEVDHGGD